MIVDDVAKEIKQTLVGYKCSETVSIGERVFGDNLVVFAKNTSKLKYYLMLWKETVKKRNVNINTENMKIMILGGQESLEIEVEGIKLERVKSFKYLGLRIQNNHQE